MTMKELVRTAAFIFVITIVVAVGLTYGNPERWAVNLVTSFVFSFCIGMSIHAILHLFTKRLERLTPRYRIAALFAIYLFGGFAGTEVGYVILKYAYFGGTFDIGNHFRLVLFNLVLATIFGSAAVVYYSLLRTASTMARKLKEKEVNEERLERLKARAELEALQAKVNPHFLFNTLNSIASLISENPAVAEATVEKLSGLFRYTLQRGENRTVRLNEELEIVRSYLEIEKVRFGDRLGFAITADGTLDDLGIPPLIIQPLVENSIKHAIALDPAGGSVEVRAERTGDSCVITVTDSGRGFASSGDGAGFGLKSIRERLNLVYGSRAALEIAREGPTEVRITLPLNDR